MADRFWSDDFDMDLPRILPRFDEALGVAADLPLWVHGGTSHGRLNHPAVWGNVAYFGTSPDDTGKPDSYYTSQPFVECTWREAVRDAWPHTYRLLVNGVEIWGAHTLWPAFEQLMYDLRGWRTLPDGEADRLRGHVLATLIAATRDLTRLTEGGRHA